MTLAHTEEMTLASPARPPSDFGGSHVNVGQYERLGSLIGGGLLTLWGVRRRSNLGAIMMLAGGSLIHRGMTGRCPLYSSIGRNSARVGPPPPQDFFQHGIHVEQTMTIDKPAAELFAFWRNFENLPRFMGHLKSVKVIDEKRSHWAAKAPAGMTAEWDAEIINEEANKLIAWTSTGNADISNAGSVRFIEAPGGRGTEVKVVLDYIAPAGRLGQFVAKLFGEEPETQVREDLRHFKQYMETGEVPTTEGQARGK